MDRSGRKWVGGTGRMVFWFAGAFVFLAPLLMWSPERAGNQGAWQSMGRQAAAVSGAMFTTDQGLTTMYRWSPAALLRSVDEGRTWAELGAGLPESPLGSPLLLALRPGAARTVYALAGPEGRRSLYRSTDSGATFDLLYQPTSFNPSLLAVSAQAEGDLVALTGDGVVAASGDGGVTWRQQTLSSVMPTAWENRPLRATVLMANVRLWIGGKGWLGYSEDRGLSWQFQSLPAEVTPSFLYAAPRGPHQLYLGLSVEAGNGRTGQGGVWRSMDRGETWQPLALPTRSQVAALVVDPLVWQMIAVGDTSGQVWVSTDWGENWSMLPGPKSGAIRALFVPPHDRSRLYASSAFDLWWISQEPVQPTPTPTLTPTATGTPPFTSTPAPEPTSTPSPTASATPSPTPTPTPTPVASPDERASLAPLQPSPTPSVTPTSVTPPAIATEPPPPPPPPDETPGAHTPPPSPTPIASPATATPAEPTPVPTPTPYR